MNADQYQTWTRKCALVLSTISTSSTTWAGVTNDHSRRCPSMFDLYGDDTFLLRCQLTTHHNGPHQCQEPGALAGAVWTEGMSRP
jgi:hypothetical protein